MRSRVERDTALRQRDTARAERDTARERAERLQRRLEKSQQKVGRLQERVDRLTLRDDLGYLFVLTYGRSGSTLLQGILNSVPGYVVRGENRQVLRHLYDYSRSAKKERQSQRRQRKSKDLPPAGNTPAHPFYGMDEFPLDGTLRGVRRLALDTLLRPDPDTRVVGFKEIRWDEEDVADFVEWLREVFPGARFIVNTRNLDDVCKSKWWAEMPDAREHLEGVEARLLAVAESLGEDAFRVHYDDYVGDPDALRPLFAWLGEPYDEARVREVLDTPHSY
jgi:hypothetical protein